MTECRFSDGGAGTCWQWVEPGEQCDVPYVLCIGGAQCVNGKCIDAEDRGIFARRKADAGR